MRCVIITIFALCIFCCSIALAQDCNQANRIVEESKSKATKEKKLLTKAVQLCDTSQYAYYRLFELEEELLKNKISSGSSKYSANKSAKIMTYLNKLIELNPANTDAEYNKIQYIIASGDFINSKKMLIELYKKTEDADLAEDCIEQIHKVDWLLSLPNNSIEKTVLFNNIGRRKDGLNQLGQFAGELGNNISGVTNKFLPSGVGLVAQGAISLIQKSRESTAFVQKLYHKKDLNKLAQKCLEQLPRRINTTGFNSDKTALMLAGIHFGLSENNTKRIHHTRQLAKLVNENFIFTEEKIILEAAFDANLTLIVKDDKSTDKQKLNYANSAIQLADNLNIKFGFTAQQKEQYIWLEENLINLEDKVYPPTPEQVALRIKNKNIKQLLKELPQYEENIANNTNLKYSLWKAAQINEFLNIYTKASKYYLQLEPYYQSNKDSLSKIKAHKITCQFLAEKIPESNPKANMSFDDKEEFTIINFNKREKQKNIWFKQLLYLLQNNENIKSNIDDLQKINTGLALINKWENSAIEDNVFKQIDEKLGMFTSMIKIMRGEEVNLSFGENWKLDFSNTHFDKMMQQADELLEVRDFEAKVISEDELPKFEEMQLDESIMEYEEVLPDLTGEYHAQAVKGGTKSTHLQLGQTTYRVAQLQHYVDRSYGAGGPREDVTITIQHQSDELIITIEKATINGQLLKKYIDFPNLYVTSVSKGYWNGSYFEMQEGELTVRGSSYTKSVCSEYTGIVEIITDNTISWYVKSKCSTSNILTSESEVKVILSKASSTRVTTKAKPEIIFEVSP